MAREPHELAESTLRLILARIGPVTVFRLREHLGDDASIVGASTRMLRGVPGVGPSRAGSYRRAIDEADPQAERREMVARGVRMILAGDDDYPPLLATIADAPPALWIRGTLRPEDQAALGVVGSRRCTAYGRRQASRFASLLGQSGLTIVSGGALGIDAEAHRAALRVGARTIAVLGCGLGKDYPRRHRELFETIVASGSALISELPMAAPPRAENFPRRNRLISGLCVGVLVIEAAHRSGALITARLAAGEHGREVMVVPGPVDSPVSAGTLRALREGWAAPVGEPSDVLEQLEGAPQLLRGALEAARARPGADQAGDDPVVAGADPGGPPGTRAAIIDALAGAPDAMGADALAGACGLPVGQVMADLTLLEISGRVVRSDGGFEIRR